MSDIWAKGAIFHPDPDTLVAYKLGYFEYDSIAEIKNAYVDGELCELELEAILEGVFERRAGLQ